MSDPMDPSRRSENVARFDELFERHRGFLLAWLIGQTGRREMALDLLQETFVRVWRHIEAAKATKVSCERIWILSLAKSALVDDRRHSRVRSNLSEAMPDSEMPSDRPTADRVVSARLTVTRLEAAIRELPPDLRTVLSLSTMSDLTSEQIGELLELPAGTVRYRLSEARNRLAKKMNL